MAESQKEQTAEQPQQAEPQKKMTPEEFQAKLASGDIDTSTTDPQTLIDEMVAFEEPEDTQEKPVETPEPSLGEVKEGPPKEEPEAPVQFKNFGELMATAKEELGDEFASARDIIVKAKNQKEHLQKMQTAVERWKNDATSADRKIAELEAKLAEKAKEVPAAPTAQPQPAPAKAEEPNFEAEIPEVDKPGEFADADEVAKYFDKVRKRDNLIADKKIKWLKTEQEKSVKAAESRIKEINRSAQERVETELRQRQEQERIERQRQESFVAANDFVRSHKEFGINDVRENDQKYSEWASQVEYLKRQNPAYQNRDLVADYFNGVSDAVQLLDGYALTPPGGAKEHAMLIELERIALSHNFVDKTTGRPNFEEAYVLKKARDGVDLEETNERVAKAVEQTVDVIQQRQSAPQSLGASEARAKEEGPSATPEQIQTRITQLQANMSSMRPDDRIKAMGEVEELMSSLGMTQLSTGA